MFLFRLEEPELTVVLQGTGPWLVEKIRIEDDGGYIYSYKL